MVLRELTRLDLLKALMKELEAGNTVYATELRKALTADEYRRLQDERQKLRKEKAELKGQYVELTREAATYWGLAQEAAQLTSIAQRCSDRSVHQKAQNASEEAFGQFEELSPRERYCFIERSIEDPPTGKVGVDEQPWPLPLRRSLLSDRPDLHDINRFVQHSAIGSAIAALEPRPTSTDDKRARFDALLRAARSF